MPKKLELYGATSQIFGDKDAGFDDSPSTSAAANFYPFDTRNHRLNVQVIDVNRSPVSSVVRLLRRRTDGHDVLGGVLGVLLSERGMT